MLIYLQSETRVIQVQLSSLAYWYAAHYLHSTHPDAVKKAERRLLWFPAGCLSKPLGTLRITLEPGSVRASSKSTTYQTHKPTVLAPAHWEMLNPAAVAEVREEMESLTLLAE